MKIPLSVLTSVINEGFETTEQKNAFWGALKSGLIKGGHLPEGEKGGSGGGEKPETMQTVKSAGASDHAWSKTDKATAGGKETEDGHREAAAAHEAAGKVNREEGNHAHAQVHEDKANGHYERSAELSVGKSSAGGSETRVEDKSAAKEEANDKSIAAFSKSKQASTKGDSKSHREAQSAHNDAAKAYKAVGEHAKAAEHDKQAKGHFESSKSGKKPTGNSYSEVLNYLVNAERCPECGGKMEGGECDECGYEEGTNNDSGPHPDMSTSVPAKRGSVNPDGRSNVRLKRQTSLAHDDENYDDYGLSTNDSPPGHLADAPRAQVQAAMASMTESGGGGSSSKEAFQAGKKADKSGKASHHKEAASTHKEAAEHHKSQGNGEMAKVHSDMARSHSQKANRTNNRRVTSNAWDGDAADATMQARKATRKANTESDDAGFSGSAHDEAEDTASSTVQSLKDNRGGKDATAQLIQDHSDAADQHDMAASQHEKMGHDDASEAHQQAAQAHRNAAEAHGDDTASNKRGNMNYNQKVNWLKRLVRNCTCASTKKELQSILNEASGTGDGSFDAALMAGRGKDGEPLIDDDNDDDDLEYPEKSRKKIKKNTMSTNEWIQQAPLDAREMLQEDYRGHQQKKASIVRRLTANISDEGRAKIRQRELMTNSLSELKELLELVGNREEASPPAEPYDPLPLYGPAGVALSTNQASGDGDVLDIPVMNFGQRP